MPPPSHCTVVSCAIISINGDVVSSIINKAVVLLELPHSSVAIKETVVEPDNPQSGSKFPIIVFQVMLPHASVAVAPPLSFNHILNALEFPDPSHSTISFDTVVVIIGASESTLKINWF